MKEITIEEFAKVSENPFKLIGKDWMLITAENGEKVNAMTASWGGVGVLWNKNVVTVYIRESRFTKELIDATDSFSLCFLPESQKQTLGYFGKVSGRNEDKIEKSGLTVEHDEKTPYFKESRLVLKCRKLYCQKMNAESFSENAKGIIDVCYKDGDWHCMYIAEIQKIFISE